ncbi:MAG TPA: hypothetical protein VFW96_18630 [Thermomicrobiales bacterium]|nr:hypothetical protein [Thermomicrobiales bacterium]
MGANPAASRRKAFLALALRRARPGSGSARSFLLARTWQELPVALDVRRLATPCVIVGGVATALYMPRRLTLDLDLLVAAPDAPTLQRELRALGWAREGTSSVGGTTWRAPDGSKVGVLESTEPWARDAVTNPNRSPAGEPVIALPYLVLLKLAASRAQDLADISRMLGTADDSALDAVRRAVGTYRPEESADLESLIALGQLELAEGGAAPGDEGDERPKRESDS